MPKGLRTLLGDLWYCQARVRRTHASDHNNLTFLGKFADHLPTQLREQYRFMALGHVGPHTFEGLMTFVQHAAATIESNPDWEL